MNTIIAIVALLQAALSLLTASAGTPLQPQAELFAKQSIMVAQQTLAGMSQVPTPTYVPTPTIQPQGGPELPQITPIQPVTPTPQSPSQSLPSNAPIQMSTIKIISPIPGKGLGREYKASSQVVDESNYIELGLVVRSDAGQSRNDLQVVITATDSSQNKTLNGTGNETKIYNNGVAEVVSYYPFHYEFKTAGQHTITFSADGLTDHVELTVI